MKRTIQITITKTLEIALPDDQVTEILHNYRDAVEEDVDISEVFNHIACYPNETYIEGIGVSGEDFEVYQTSQDIEYDEL